MTSLSHLAAAFDRPDGGDEAVSVNNVLTVEVAGGATVGGNQFEMIADVDWVGGRERNGGVFFGTKFCDVFARKIFYSRRAEFCADAFGADVNDRSLSSRAADDGRQDGLRLLKFGTDIGVPPVHGVVGTGLDFIHAGVVAGDGVRSGAAARHDMDGNAGGF